MADTERVVMIWPKDLKDKVRETAGKRGITEFTIKAVGIHLGVDEDLTAVEKELDEVKHFAQQLADQLVLGVESPEERLQTLMEVEFPSWVDTSGWPKTFADRVRPEIVEPVPEKVVVERVIASSGDGSPVDGLMDHFGVEYTEMVAKEPATVEPAKAPESVETAPPPAADLPHDRQSKDDLFARVMAKTGGKLSDVPGLKVASAIERPEVKKIEPEATSETCATCGEELVDGECWTCG